MNVKKLHEQDSGKYEVTNKFKDSIGKINLWISNDMIDKEIFEG